MLEGENPNSNASMNQAKTLSRYETLSVENHYGFQLFTRCCYVKLLRLVS